MPPTDEAQTHESALQMRIEDGKVYIVLPVDEAQRLVGPSAVDILHWEDGPVGAFFGALGQTLDLT